MKLLKLYLFLIVFNINIKKSDGQVKFLNPPPGTVSINDSIFFDINEISNISYKEYKFWVKRVFGENSKEYANTQIDTFLVNNEYQSSFAFDSHPALGLTHEQAKSFCEWRSDRVLEMYLIENNIIDIRPNQNRFDYFSIKYLREGNVRTKDSLKLMAIPFPEYRLPSESEWEMAASEGADTNRYWHNISKPLKKKERVLVSNNQEEIFKKNKYGIYNLFGNAAEMIDVKGISKGYHFKVNTDQMLISGRMLYTQPERWLGFRCICQFKPIINKL